MSTIQSIKAREIKDSQGRATVEAMVKTDDGEFVDSVPAGISVGATEAKTQPAGQAVQTINVTIAAALQGLNPVEQTTIDATLLKLDGTLAKSNLGANALLPVSLACARAAAASQRLPLYKWLAHLCGVPTRLPLPMMVMISGGEHGKGNVINVQEFMVVGDTAAGSKVLQAVQAHLNHEHIPWEFGPEGGLAPKLLDDSQAIGLVNQFKGQLWLAIDVAASHRRSVVDMVNWIDKYRLLAIEDGFGQEDWEIWQKFTADFGSRVNIVGDDLFTTNPERVKRGIELKAANAVVLKPNQIGTLTEVFDVARMARRAGWSIVVSHRSGETMDDFIADLAVAVGAQFLKAGAPQLPERKVKYERLEKIKQGV